MKISRRSSAQAIALILGAIAATPVAWAHGTAVATSDTGSEQDSMTAPIANYDGFDWFRDAAGHALPGWEFLFNSPG